MTANSVDKTGRSIKLHSFVGLNRIHVTARGLTGKVDELGAWISKTGDSCGIELTETNKEKLHF